MTWVGSGEKEGESFHVCFSAAQCWRGTVAEQGSAWSASKLYGGYHDDESEESGAEGEVEPPVTKPSSPSKTSQLKSPGSQAKRTASPSLVRVPLDTVNDYEASQTKSVGSGATPGIQRLPATIPLKNNPSYNLTARPHTQRPSAAQRQPWQEVNDVKAHQTRSVGKNTVQNLWSMGSGIRPGPTRNVIAGSEATVEAKAWPISPSARRNPNDTASAENLIETGRSGQQCNAIGSSGAADTVTSRSKQSGLLALMNGPAENGIAGLSGTAPAEGQLPSSIPEAQLPHNYRVKEGRKGLSVRQRQVNYKTTEPTPYRGKKLSEGLFRCKGCDRRWHSSKTYGGHGQECLKCGILQAPYKQFPLRRMPPNSRCYCHPR